MLLLSFGLAHGYVFPFFGLSSHLVFISSSSNVYSLSLLFIWPFVPIHIRFALCTCWAQKIDNDCVKWKTWCNSKNYAFAVWLKIVRLYANLFGATKRMSRRGQETDRYSDCAIRECVCVTCVQRRIAKSKYTNYAAAWPKSNYKHAVDFSIQCFMAFYAICHLSSMCVLVKLHAFHSRCALIQSQ